jgi:WD40 repeat protein
LTDVFISYSRRDSGYVQRLQQELASRGKDVWVDTEGIRDAEVFPAALRRAVEGSDAFVFVISPDSVRSPFCGQEVDHAVELNKRVVPLALREVADVEIPEEIRFRNWIPVGTTEFAEGVDRLVAAIDTDLEWERQHTRLTVKALEWDAAGRDRSFLVRGSELAAAEQWLAAGADKDPGPTALEQEYLLAARAAASRRQRLLVGISAAVAAVSVGLLVFALISRSEAISAGLVAKARALAAESETQLAVDPERSILLARAAVLTSPISDALFALRAALDASAIRYRLPDAGLQNCGQGLVTASPGVAFSPVGHRLAEGLCNGTIVLADSRTGRVIRRVDVGAPGGPVAYNRGGSLLAVAAGRRVLLLDAATGRIDRAVAGNAVAGRIAFSPTGSLAFETARGGLALWDSATGRTRTLISGGESSPPITSLVFSPDGKRLAVGLAGAAPNMPGLLLLDARTGRVEATHRVPVDDVAFSANGQLLIVAETPTNGSEGSFAVLDAHTLALHRTLLTLPSVEASAVALSPNGAAIAYGGFDGTAGLISASSGQSLVSYLGQTARVTQIAFSPDGALVATASADGTLRVWRATALEIGSQYVGPAIADLAPAGRGFVVLGQPPGTNEIAVEQWPGFGEARSRAPLELSPTATVDAEFTSTNGRLAGLIGSSPTVPLRIWSVPQRRVIASVSPSRTPFGGEPTFSPDGSLIAMNTFLALSSSSAGPPSSPGPPGPQLVVVNVKTSRARALTSTTCGLGWRSFPFSANGKLLAGGSFCGGVGVFDVATGRRVGKPFQIGGELSKIAFSPDGRRIAVGSWDSTVTVADVATGRVVAVLTNHTKGVADVAYSPNGAYLASASLDDTVEIWDARTLTLLRIIHQPDPTNVVTFTRDSRDILTLDSAGVVREWDACTACGNAKALLALARARVTRQLTPQEQRTFGTG